MKINNVSYFAREYGGGGVGRWVGMPIPLYF